MRKLKDFHNSKEHGECHLVIYINIIICSNNLIVCIIIFSGDKGLISP